MPTLDALQSLEYPRHVHLPSVPPDWRYRVVRTPDECSAALADGYSLTLTVVSQAPVPLPPAGEPSQSGEAPAEPPPVGVVAKKRGWPLGKKRGPHGLRQDSEAEVSA